MTNFSSSSPASHSSTSSLVPLLSFSVLLKREAVLSGAGREEAEQLVVLYAGFGPPEFPRQNKGGREGGHY
ncbi:rCG28782, isoform CRA_b [Rattus norvegicus]|uniref:RCG28782, isoform CRA_b n=1 Tax=Rattus norvegicus TaxID=10116 RepID=A6HV73_RAT|nr:rCG28782, isoform CRA_b [Rattus norvegicus]